MNKSIDIQFTGLTTSPSDYACNDGDLAVCHNLVNEHGELRPVMPPGLAFNLQSGSKLLYVHKTSTATMAIHADSTKVYYSKLELLKADNISSEILPSITAPSVKSAISVGNILIITDGNGDSHYYRFANGEYKYLGKGLPELPKISFGLHTIRVDDDNGIPDRYSDIYNDLGTIHEPEPDRYPAYSGHSVGVDGKTVGIGFSSPDTNSTVYDACMGKINAHHRVASEIGAFTEPFLVRYCYRLYNGDVARWSPPVLMIPSTKLQPVVLWNESGAMTPRTYNAPISYLYYRISDAPDLSAWGDIISSVDILVSLPLMRWRDVDYSSWRRYFNSEHGSIDPSVNLDGLFALRRQYTNIAEPELYGVYEVIGSDGLSGSMAIQDDGTIKRDRFNIYIPTYPDATDGHVNYYFTPKVKTPSDLQEDLRRSSNFYFAAEIALPRVVVGDTFVRADIGAGVLNTLPQSERLPEDYLTNYSTRGGRLFVYNSRLLVFNVLRDYTTPYTCELMWQYVYQPNNSAACFVRLRKNGAEYCVSVGSGEFPKSSTAVSWLSYPDPDAVEYLIRITSTASTRVYFRIPLKRHDYLQCAYWCTPDKSKAYSTSMSDWKYETVSVNADGTDDVIGQNRATSIPFSNLVQVSEVNNPFVFPSRLSATVGNDNIMALAVTTLPISEGQQGQFPVMAFTDEGIWALSVSGEGSLSATNPMLRDVLLSPESLCVIDDGVVYAAKEGLRILRGKQSVSITDSLKDAFAGGAMLPNKIPALLHDPADFAPPDEGKAQSWAKGCRIVYASALQRLYVLTTGMAWSVHTALVYSLTTGAWSSCAFRYKDPVDAYPTTYVQMDSKVYDVNVVEESAENSNAVVLTRPLTFGARNTPKTIMGAIVRGNINTRATERTTDGWETDPVTGEKRYGTWKVLSEVNTVLYGSNDLDNWFAVVSAASGELRNRAGTPYKYFRLLVLAPSGLYTQKSIAGATFDVQHRLNNTLR